MYHFIRDLKTSPFPGLKALSVEDFDGQLAYLEANYCFPVIEDVIAAVRGEAVLPDNSAVLTFDDGYIDIYDNVFSRLHERGIQGWFFIPAIISSQQHLMNVNKIQLIISQCPNIQLLVKYVDDVAIKHAGGMAALKEYYRTWYKPGRYDHESVKYVKMMLQVGLPREIRELKVSELFARWISSDEADIAQQLYVKPYQLKEMIKAGQYIGPHGVNHEWMDQMDQAEAEREIEQSLEFMGELEAPTKDWVFAYPSGSYSSKLVEICMKSGAAIGLTTEPRISDLEVDNRMLLPRLDTNDLQKNSITQFTDHFHQTRQ